MDVAPFPWRLAGPMLRGSRAPGPSFSPSSTGSLSDLRRWLVVSLFICGSQSVPVIVSVACPIWTGGGRRAGCAVGVPAGHRLCCSRNPPPGTSCLSRGPEGTAQPCSGGAGEGRGPLGSVLFCSEAALPACPLGCPMACLKDSSQGFSGSVAAACSDIFAHPQGKPHAGGLLQLGEKACGKLLDRQGPPAWGGRGSRITGL